MDFVKRILLSLPPEKPHLPLQTRAFDFHHHSYPANFYWMLQPASTWVTRRSMMTWGQKTSFGKPNQNSDSFPFSIGFKCWKLCVERRELITFAKLNQLLLFDGERHFMILPG
jgi:hypothetical protein